MTSSNTSSGAKPPTKARRSTTSWKTPQPGDVINYAYLWAYEADQGQTEGLKDRPCVIVVAIDQDAEGLKVVVCPMTSQTPHEESAFVEVPATVKRHLGLTDREKSYVITSEINRFEWPGPDLRPFDRDGRTDIFYGQIPARLFTEIKTGILSQAKQHRLKTTPRD